VHEPANRVPVGSSDCSTDGFIALCFAEWVSFNDAQRRPVSVAITCPQWSSIGFALNRAEPNAFSLA